MKKVLLIAALAVFGLGVSNAQEAGFKLGVSAALPMGDMGDVTTFGFGIDAAYLWEISDEFHVGAATGYYHFFGDDLDLGMFGTIEMPDFQFIPLAATARYYVSEEFFVGADLGYGMAIGDYDGGDFYYRPKVGYSFGSVAAHVSYAGIGDFSFIGIGIEFGL
jgi:hypothetical protein